MDPNPQPDTLAILVGGFSKEERAKILGYLGYPQYFNLGPAIAFGYPAASQPLFVVDDAFGRITPAARELVRQDVCRLDAIECAISKDAAQAGVAMAGGVTFNIAAGRRRLMAERARLVRLLADHLGVFANPMSQTYGVGRRVMNT